MKSITLEEMSEINRRLRDEKAEFISRLKVLLKADRRSEVESLRYDIVPAFDEEGRFVTSYEEIITIRFKGGLLIKTNVTGCSCKAIYKDVGRAVYG